MAARRSARRPRSIRSFRSCRVSPHELPPLRNRNCPPAALNSMPRAIIFDLDGTLADTEPLHFEAFNQVLRNEGIELARDDYFARLIG
ncbi:MAG: HAD hydrolase-like protein, partial [Candidatus Binataceae bacterium]